MGNRAVIAFTDLPSAPCVYVHWNGGRASIEGFLRAAKALNIEPSMSELHRLIAGFLGTSAYFQTVGKSDADNHDNGMYLISREWEITGRRHVENCYHYRDEIDPEKTEAIAIDCIEAYQIWPN